LNRIKTTDLHPEGAFARGAWGWKAKCTCT
jgi:hypothetical protein